MTATSNPTKQRWPYLFTSVFLAALLFACTSSAREFPTAEEIIVEQSLIQCWLELTDMYKSVMKSLMDDMATMPDDTKLEISSKEGNIENIIYRLPRQCQIVISKCLEKPNLLLCSSGEVLSAQNWYRLFPDSVFSWQDTSKRQLADPRREITSSFSTPSRSLASKPPVVPKLAPQPAVASTPPPAPEPASVPTPTPEPNASEESASPAPSPNYYYYIFPPESSNPDNPDNETGLPSLEPASIRSEKNTSGNWFVAISVIIIGAGLFILIGLLFFCFYKLRKDDDDLLSDDGPLITLRSSNLSKGSSHKSHGFGSSVNRDKLGMLSLRTDPSQISCKSSVGTSTIGNVSDDAHKDKPSSPPTTSNDTLNDNKSPKADNKSPKASSPPSSPTKNIGPAPPPPPPKPGPGPPPPPPKLGPSPPPPPTKTGPGPPPPPTKTGPGPPPPPKGPRPPGPPGPPGLGRGKSPPGPPVPKFPGGANDASKPKLKPFFWDKVLATPDQSMVWHQISAGSFQFNEEKIETLFGYNAAGTGKSEMKKDSSSTSDSTQTVRILDHKKSQNLSILLKALNVTKEEVCDALIEGNELPNELLQTLLKMAPTSEEELKLRLFSDDISLLGSAECFLKSLVEIPFAYKRLDSLLFMGTLQEDIASIKESFQTLEVACTELTSSRLFLKLLEAVLKTGNRMNVGTYRGGAQAFKLDTLLKLADVKGTDGKTTLLLFVVQEMIRSEGMRAARIARESGSSSSIDPDDQTDEYYRSLGIEVVSGIGNELENVKKAAILDVNALTSSVANLGEGLVKTKEFLDKDMKTVDEDNGFHLSLKCFVEHAEIGVTSLLEEEKKIRALVKSTTDYFHGSASKDEGLHLFVIVRDFIGMLEKVCREVKLAQKAHKKVTKAPEGKSKDTPAPKNVPDPKQLLFPAIIDQRLHSSSSDDEDS